jgi:hypothetical protein
MKLGFTFIMLKRYILWTWQNLYSQGVLSFGTSQSELKFFIKHFFAENLHMWQNCWKIYIDISMTSISEALQVMRRKKEQGINLSYKGTWRLTQKIILLYHWGILLNVVRYVLYLLMHLLHTRVHKTKPFSHIGVYRCSEEVKEYEQWYF